jgi:hypothetical protein
MDEWMDTWEVYRIFCVEAIDQCQRYQVRATKSACKQAKQASMEESHLYFV